MGSFEIKVAAANSSNNEGKRGFVSFKKTCKSAFTLRSFETGFPAVYGGSFKLQEEIPAAVLLHC